MRTTFDLTPLHRSTIGFDRLTRLLEQSLNGETGNGFPPYNIERLDEDRYRITMAVAGFSQDDLDINLQDGALTIRGKASRAEEEDEERRLLYRGIATRAFERRFQLADYVEVVGADLENGLLHVELERRVPERLKPRSIPIGTLQSAKAAPEITQDAA